MLVLNGWQFDRKDLVCLIVTVAFSLCVSCYVKQRFTFVDV